MKAGDKFKKVYPYCAWSESYETYAFTGFPPQSRGVETNEGWRGGCDRHTEDGPAVYEGQCIQEEFHTCDAEGFIEYEVLAIAEMPRKYQDRIIYRVTMIEPEGGERKSSKAHMVTRTKFEEWINSGHSSYPYDYEVV
jgi:hypothetical protein